MFHRGRELSGLGDGPADRENDAFIAVASRGALRQGLHGGEADGPREALKQVARPRSVLGNITNSQTAPTLKPSTQQEQTNTLATQPPAKLPRVEPVPDIDTMNRLPTDPDYEPPCAAEKLFAAIDAHDAKLPQREVLLDSIPESPPDPFVEEEEPFSTPLTFLEELAY